MYFRTRTRMPQGVNPGTITYTGPEGTFTSSRPDPIGADFVEDFTSSHFNAFRAKSTTVDGSIINGTCFAWGGTNTYSNVPFARQTDIDFKLDIVPNNGYLETATLAKTNPNRADMSVPNSLFELRELPSLIKQAGHEAINILKKNISLKTVANLNLMVQFGVAPMVQDLLTLSKFQKSVERRLQNLQSVRRTGGVTKTKRLGKYHDKSDDVLWFWDGSAFLVSTMTQVTTVEAWGSTRWELDPSYTGNLYSSHDSDRNLLIAGVNKLLGLNGQHVTGDQLNAFRAAYGLYQYGIDDLWNILPFSWLTDYFSNCGDVVAANANQLGLNPTKAALMKRSTVTRTHPAMSGSGINISPLKLESVLKTRMPIDIQSARANITMKVPLITGNQMGILSSLIFSKGRSQNGKSGSLSNPYVSYAHRVLAGISQNSYLFKG